MLSLERKMKIFAPALTINNIKSFVQMRILQVEFRYKILNFFKEVAKCISISFL